MAKNTTNQFALDITLATLALDSMNLKGERPNAVKAFLTADSDDAREAVVESIGAGMIRRGMRQIARRLERKGDQDGADVFWALRDDIDEDDDSVFRIETSIAA